MIHIRVKFFSLYSDIAGKEDHLVFDKEVSIRELVRKILEKYPGLSELFERVKPLILVNGSPINGDQVLHDGDEVAFLPPASGG